MLRSINICQCGVLKDWTSPYGHDNYQMATKDLESFCTYYIVYYSSLTQDALQV